jgi:hypothetical protein
MLTKPDDVPDIFTATHSSRAIEAHHGESGDAWRMSQGTTTVISGPQRSLPIRAMTSANGVTSIARTRGP